LNRENRGTGSNLLRILLAEDDRLNQKVTLRFLRRLGILRRRSRQWYRDPQGLGAPVLRPDSQGHTDAGDGQHRGDKGHTPSLVQGSSHVIIAFMAFALETSRERCLVTGMDEYITKPVRGKELEDALKRFQ